MRKQEELFKKKKKKMGNGRCIASKASEKVYTKTGTAHVEIVAIVC